MNTEGEFENESENELPPLGTAIGQLKGAYILAENDEGLVVVEQAVEDQVRTYRAPDAFGRHECLSYQTLRAVVGRGEEGTERKSMAKKRQVGEGEDLEGKEDPRQTISEREERRN